jgi:glycosyltransferase involved in cell wall biosynthesis
LDRTLARMGDLFIPSGVDWEVLVVNNNCTDRTEAILDNHANRLPLRQLFAAMPGKSNALNLAVSTIHSDLILWTDDDVLVDENWLAGYVDAARIWPSHSFFGGPITPWFEAAPPVWLISNWSHLAAVYATRQFGEESFDIRPESLPYGASFAIRTRVQRQYRYDPRIGRNGKGMLGGEETSLVLRMLCDGHLGRYVPNARVRHFVPRERMSLEYLRRFYFGLGQTDVIDGLHPSIAPASRTWSTSKTWSKALFAEARYQLTRRVAKPQRWVKDLTKSSYYWGRLAGQQNDTPAVKAA